MALDSTHPQYDEFISDWTLLRDSYIGSKAIKRRGVAYLPPTQGMVLDGMLPKQLGFERYNAYLIRAVYPEYVQEAVEAYVGALNSKPAKITLPSALEPLRESATVNGESLEQLLRRIHEEQLVSGRLGLLLDLPLNPDPAKPLPYIATYTAESIRNWDDGQAQDDRTSLNLVILDETTSVRKEDFKWEIETRYRVLQLGELDENERSGVYSQGVFSTSNGTPTFDASRMVSPSVRGKTLDEIPFVFVNTKDISPSVDKPPLLSLANEALTVYRSEADYRQTLFASGQDTLVVIGGVKLDGAEGEDSPLRTGAGARIDIEQGGDAKYIGINSQGLPEQRSAIENDRKRAEVKAGQLIRYTGDAESGEALKTRLAAQTATLNQIALTAAGALKRILQIAAEWVGANPSEVDVIPNMEFGYSDMTGKELVDLVTARTMGAPLSMKSIHAVMVSRNLTKLDFEAEQELINEEDASRLTPPTNPENEGQPNE